MSIFLAMFCWMCIGQNQVTLLELLGIFLILCVGDSSPLPFRPPATTSPTPYTTHSAPSPPIYPRC